MDTAVVEIFGGHRRQDTHGQVISEFIAKGLQVLQHGLTPLLHVRTQADHKSVHIFWIGLLVLWWAQKACVRTLVLLGKVF